MVDRAMCRQYSLSTCECRSTVLAKRRDDNSIVIVVHVRISSLFC
jgi:hypothetical protein